MRYPWSHLPVPLRLDLLHASSGRAHLLGMAAAAFDGLQSAEQTGQTGSRQTLLALGCGLYTAAWEEGPLDPATLTQLGELDKATQCLNGPTRILARRLVAAYTPPADNDLARLETLLRQGDLEGVQRRLEQGLHSDGLVRWFAQVTAFGFRFAWHDWLGDLLAAPLPEPFAALGAAAQADLAFVQGRYADAAQGYATATAKAPLGLWRERLGETLARLGERDEALRLWEGVLRERPWHVQLWSRYDGLRQNLDLPGAFPEGRGAILLYTWNGGLRMEKTLDALAASQWPDAPDAVRIVVIDNGSTDGQTPDILRAQQERLAGRMRLITLPCNVGAPPARNWLRTEVEAREAEWLVYLDDDLLPPPDWLRHFGTAMRHAPHHGVYGCRVVREDKPALIQAADMNLLPAGQSVGPGWLPISRVHIQASFHASGETDFGQISYTRPCTHVAGCCHLFRRAHLDRIGGFDLRFAPTQVDDFEHDIRMAVAGDLPLYHGYLGVRHMHATGTTTSGNLAKAMNAHANHLKLQALYPPDGYEALRETLSQPLLRDVIRKQATLPETPRASEASRDA